jgi:hypothetical protein
MRYLKTYKIFESVDKFENDFVSLIKNILSDLTDIDYNVHISTGKHSQMSTEQSFNRFKRGSVMADALKIRVYTDSIGFNVDVLKPVLEDIKNISTDFNFLVDIYIPEDDEYVSVDDAIDLCSETIGKLYTIGEYDDMTIIIH